VSKDPSGSRLAFEEVQHHSEQRHSPPVALALLLLALGLSHLAMVPGTTIDGRRSGWDGTLWWPGDPSLLITWPLGVLLLAAAMVFYVLGALRPLGLPLGPRNWLRWTIGAVATSAIACAFTWPGLEPAPFLFAVIPLSGIAVLVAWQAGRLYYRGPFAGVESRVGAPRKHHPWILRFAMGTGKGLGTSLVILVVAVGTWFLVPAWTPPIVDAHGNHVPGSIAGLETVRLGGSEQWILIRGWSTNNPVLLVLPGGPGGSYLGEGPRVWGELEKHFTVVEWDPRGVTKSYDALNPTSRVTIPQIVSDTIQLSEQLRTRFHQSKIYLLGHSGGSIYGIWAVKQRPDLYAAYIGGSQMVNNRLTDQSIYDKLLKHAVQTSDQSLARMLRTLGNPPYYGPSVLLTDLTNVVRMGDGLAMKYGNVIFTARDVFEAPRSEESAAAKQALGPNLGGMFSPEFNLMDKINYFRGLNDVFTVLYPQLQGFDFRRDAPVLKVPVYFMLGEYDVNGTELSVDYFHTLQAPHKRLYIFPKGSHGEIFTQPERFIDIMVSTVLPETQS
jgi:pimeloyl-ACP methyl ester carboxylesterase